jgi:hypothetical protein
MNVLAAISLVPVTDALGDVGGSVALATLQLGSCIWAIAGVLWGARKLFHEFKALNKAIESDGDPEHGDDPWAGYTAEDDARDRKAAGL